MATDKPKLKDASGFCDFFMNRGIKGISDTDAVTRASVLTEVAIQLKRADALAKATEWIETSGKRPLSEQNAIILDLTWANAIAGKRYGTTWEWELPTLTQEIFHLRRAISNSDFENADRLTKCRAFNNLGRRLMAAGRLIEALDCWRRAVQLQTNFGMAFLNRARALSLYASAIGDGGHRVLFLWTVHREASTGLSDDMDYVDDRNPEAMRHLDELKRQIEAQVDVAALTADNPLAEPDEYTTEEERVYHRWCLENYLTLNPSNDLGPYDIASTDSLSLPVHVIPVDSPHTYGSFFDQMAQEFVSARWLLYEGLTAGTPHISDRDVILARTEPCPALSLAVEKIKASYKTAYSIFDKIAYFLNSYYMDLNIKENQVVFRWLFRPDKKPIRPEFDQRNNWAFCALYWMGKDFFVDSHDDVAEPQARALYQIRNHLQHKYLRITIDPAPPQPANDLAFMVSRQDFEQKALHLLRQARAALIYLSLGVGIEEERRASKYANSSVVELPADPSLPYEKKI